MTLFGLQPRGPQPRSAAHQHQLSLLVVATLFLSLCQEQGFQGVKGGEDSPFGPKENWLPSLPTSVLEPTNHSVALQPEPRCLYPEHTSQQLAMGIRRSRLGVPGGLGKCSSVASSTADTLPRELTAAPDSWCLVGALMLSAWGGGPVLGSWAALHTTCSHHDKPPLLGAPGPELGSIGERRLSQHWGVGRSISEPGIFQGVTMEHVRKGGDHQSVVRALW